MEKRSFEICQLFSESELGECSQVLFDVFSVHLVSFVDVMEDHDNDGHVENYEGGEANSGSGLSSA